MLSRGTSRRGLEEGSKSWITIVLVGVGVGLVLAVILVFFFKRFQRRKAPQFEEFVDPHPTCDHVHSVKSGPVGGTQNSRFQHLAYQNELSDGAATRPSQNESAHRQSSQVAILEDVQSSIQSASTDRSRQPPPPVKQVANSRPPSRINESQSPSVENIVRPSAQERPKSSRSSKHGHGHGHHQKQSKAMSAAESRAAKKAALISQLGGTGLANNAKATQQAWHKRESSEFDHHPPSRVPVQDAQSFNQAPARIPVQDAHSFNQPPSRISVQDSQSYVELRDAPVPEMEEQVYKTEVNNPDDTLPLGAEAGSYFRRQKKNALLQAVTMPSASPSPSQSLPRPAPSVVSIRLDQLDEDQLYRTEANNPDDTLPLGAEAGTYRKKAALLHNVKAPTQSARAPLPSVVMEERDEQEFRPFDDEHLYETSQMYDSMPLGMEAGHTTFRSFFDSFAKMDETSYEESATPRLEDLEEGDYANQNSTAHTTGNAPRNASSAVGNPGNAGSGCAVYSMPAQGIVIPPSKTPKRWPRFKFVWFMISVNTVMFVIEIGVNGWTVESTKLNPLIGPSAIVLLEMGAQRTDLIFAGDWWRLFTAMFLHAGIVHLVFNMFALYQLGTELEATFDRRRVVIVYFVTGLIGAMVSAVFVPNVVGVGASGAIFGLFGATFAEFLLNWELYTNRCCHMTNLIVVAVFNLGIGLLPYVNNFAHMSGFLSGFGMGFAMLSLPTTRQDRIANTRSPKQRRLGRIGATFAAVYALLFVILLSTHSDASKACPWCKYLDCIPAPWWSCDASASGECYGYQFTNGTLIITCPAGQNVTAPLGRDFTAATCTSVCT